MKNKTFWTIVGVGAVGILTGGIGLVCAPVIAATAGGAGLLGACATTGTAISTLSGVALTNASLAALGTGAISAGGFGIAGGTAVVATAAGAAGAGVGAATVGIAKNISKIK